MTTHEARSELRLHGSENVESVLASRIEDLIQARANGRILDLQVVCSADAIVLLGRAPTFYAKQLAQEAALDATDLGVDSFFNRIVVA